MELVLFGRGWDLLRPGNPIKVPRDAAVGIYLDPKNPFKVPLYFGAGVSFHGWDLFRPRNPIKVPLGAGAMLCFRGWDLFRPKNPIKVPRWAGFSQFCRGVFAFIFEAQKSLKRVPLNVDGVFGVLVTDMRVFWFWGVVSGREARWVNFFYCWDCWLCFWLTQFRCEREYQDVMDV